MRTFLTSTALFAMTTTFAAADAVEICLFDEENWESVVAACSEALTASNDPVEQGRFILHRGLAQEALGNLRAARLDNILAGSYRPDWFRGFANAASLSSEMGDEAARLRWARAAIDAEPENPRAYSELLIMQNNSDDPQSCGPTADQILSLLPHPYDWPFMASGDSYLMGNLGFCLQRVEQPERALQAYQAADYLGLDTAWFHSNMAYVAYYQLGRAELAILHSTRAIEVDEATHYDVDTLAYSLVALGDLDGAFETVTEYAEVLDNQVAEWGTRNVVGWTLFLEDRLDEAATVMEAWAAWAEAEMAEGRETEGYIWDTVAHIRAARNETEGAVEAFRRAFEFYADQEEVRTLYGDGLTELGFDIGEGDEGLLAALDDCAATGPACRIIPDDDFYANAEN